MTLLIRAARYPFSSSRYELHDILEGEIVNDSKFFIFSWAACHLLYVNLCCCESRKWLYLNSDYGVSETQTTITFSPISQGAHSNVSTIEYLCLLNSSPLWLILFFGGDSRCSTLRRWKDGKQMDVWEAHKAPIQAVLKLPSGELVTGIDST